MTAAGRAKIAASNRRRTVTAETRAKMSRSLKQALDTPRFRRLRAESNTARVWTDEARAKIGAVHRGKPKSPETREKMRQAAIRAHARRAMLRASTNTV